MIQPPTHRTKYTLDTRLLIIANPLVRFFILQSIRQLLFVVYIEVYGSLAESDLSHAEELLLIMSVLGYFSFLLHFDIKVKNPLDHMAFLNLLTHILIIDSSRRLTV